MAAMSQDMAALGRFRPASAIEGVVLI